NLAGFSPNLRHDPLPSKRACCLVPRPPRAPNSGFKRALESWGLLEPLGPKFARRGRRENFAEFVNSGHSIGTLMPPVCSPCSGSAKLGYQPQKSAARIMGFLVPLLLPGSC